ncbi:hypothetical protein VTI74DRAFT_1758 [Chaetomium olivicolor]
MIRASLLTLTGLNTLAAALPGHRQQSDDTWKQNIKNIVVLVEENRSFDTFLGGLAYRGDLDGLINRNFCNPVNVSNPAQGQICASENATNIDPQDPNHGISGVNFQLFSTYHPDEAAVAKSAADPQKFVNEHASVYNAADLAELHKVMDYYAPKHIPVFSTLAENFLVFSQWFAAVPGPTNPNRAYLTSGTSAGHGRNDNAFNIYGLKQKSIFEQLSEYNITWINYQNSTTGPGVGFNPDANFYEWTAKSGKNVTNVKPLSQFYVDAAAGNLPQFTYINPECCSYQSFHPASPINEGEAFVKGIYEALRNSPQWQNTLFILTFDEHGGFADHVPPPVGVPPGDNLSYTETAPDGKQITFNFDRLGLRVPTLLISPWVPKGSVEHQGINNGKHYTHTSILGFVAELWNLPKLTPRVEWSATFEHVLLGKPRIDGDVIKDLPEPVNF